MMQQIGYGVSTIDAYQLIVFGSAPLCETAIPIVSGEAISFYLIGYADNEPLLSLVNDDGRSITLSSLTANMVVSSGHKLYFHVVTLPPNLKVGECWRIEAVITGNEQETYTQLSVPLKVQPTRNDDFAYVQYSCDEDTFGFPFHSILYNNANSYIACRMPLHIHKPQFKTEDEVYKTLDGNNVILYSAFAEEYEIETEYIPYDWHRKIIAALSCDHVTIDGYSVYKSSEYSIDWDNYMLDDCGNKRVKASCKVLVNHREINSNIRLDINTILPKQ